MKIKTRIFLFLSLVLIISIVFISILINNQSCATRYIGENAYWLCDYTVNKDKNEKTGLYETKLTVKYKREIIPAEKVSVKLMCGDFEISSCERIEYGNDNEMKGYISTENGTSGKPIYNMPLTVIVSINDGEYESIPLSTYKPVWYFK